MHLKELLVWIRNNVTTTRLISIELYLPLILYKRDPEKEDIIEAVVEMFEEVAYEQDLVITVGMRLHGNRATAISEECLRQSENQALHLSIMLFTIVFRLDLHSVFGDSKDWKDLKSIMEATTIPKNFYLFGQQQFNTLNSLALIEPFKEIIKGTLMMSIQTQQSAGITVGKPDSLEVDIGVSLCFLQVKNLNEIIYKDLLKNLNKHDNLNSLSFVYVNDTGQFKMFSQLELKKLLKYLSKAIKDSNVEHVKFCHNQDWTKTFEGKRVLEAISNKKKTNIENKVDFYIKSGKRAKYNKSKVMFVGHGGVGKTSTLRSLLGKTFKTQPVSTVVADFNNEVYCDINLDNWKTGNENGNQAFQSDLTALAIDISMETKKSESSTARAPVQQIQQQQKYIFENSTEGIVDLENERHHFKSLIQYGTHTSPDNNTYSIPEEVISPSSTRLAVWDFGGQEVFDVLHNLYLTSEGLCMVVFNLENVCMEGSLSKKELLQLSIWLKSITIYSEKNKVFLIGTRCESKVVQKYGLENADNLIEEVIAKFESLTFIPNEENKIYFFPVDNSLGNKNKLYLAPLKKQMVRTLADNSIESTFNTLIPLSWTFFMMNICQKEKNITNFESIKQKGLIIGFSETELAELISFFSKAGAILDFQDIMKSNKKNDNIVLRPKFLLDSLARFIYHKKYHKNAIKDAGAKVNKQHGQNFVKFASIYRKHGILGDAIFYCALSEIGVSKREVCFLRALCIRMMIFSPIHALPEKIEIKESQKNLCKVYFLVPSMIPLESKCEDINTFFNGNANLSKGTVKWKVDVPQRLYARIVTSFIFYAKYLEGLKLINISIYATQIELRKVKISLEYEKDNIINVIIGKKSENCIKEVTKIFLKIKNDLKFLSPKFKKFSENMIIEFDKEESEEDNKKTEEIDKNYDCHLSHNWGPNNKTHETVLQYSKELKKRGISVLIDDENLSEFDYGAFLKKVESSRVFVAFLTKEYLRKCTDEKTNVFKELKTKRHGKCVFVILEKDLLISIDKKKTFVASLVENKTQINFTTKENVEKNFDKFCLDLKP